MTNGPTSEPACPRCDVAIQPDWDWCHACGYDPMGLRPSAADPLHAPSSAASGPSTAAARPSAAPATGTPRPTADPPRPRNVYEPDEHRRLVQPRTAALCAGLVLTAVVLAAAGRMATDPGEVAAPDGLPDTPVTFDEGVTDLGDGWTHIAIEGGAVEVELPGPLLRTRADPLVEDLGPLPTAVWGGGTAGVELYGVAVAELPDDWRSRAPGLLDVVPLPVGTEVVVHQRSPIQVGDHAAVRIEADGRDGELRGVVVATEDRLVTLVYGGSSPAATDDAITRMLRSLELG